MKIVEGYYFDKEYSQSFMSNRLTIKIWEKKIEHNLKRYQWHIRYESNSWYTFNWDIPWDISKIAPDIWIYIDIEAAKIIYKSIIDHYNDMFVGIQNERDFITEGYVGYNMVDVINFPPFECYEDEIKRFSCLSDYAIRYTTNDTNVSDGTYWVPNYITMTHDEYERKLAAGQINQNDIYLIIN